MFPDPTYFQDGNHHGKVLGIAFYLILSFFLGIQENILEFVQGREGIVHLPPRFPHATGNKHVNLNGTP